MKKVFLIHGWGGSPVNEWFPWLKEKLEEEGFRVEVPKMPNSLKPKKEEWINHLKKVVKKVDENTLLVGHSLGCQGILRFLETLNDGKAGAVVLIAGFTKLSEESYEEEGDRELAEPWLEAPINWDKVRSRSDSWTAFFSDNDPYVPLSNADVFREKLGAKIIVDHDQGHYDQNSGIMEIPSVFSELMLYK